MPQFAQFTLEQLEEPGMAAELPLCLLREVLGESHHFSAQLCFLHFALLGDSGVGGALGWRGTWARGGSLALTGSTSSPFLDQERLPEDGAGDRHAQSGAGPHCGHHVQRLW